MSAGYDEFAEVYDLLTFNVPYDEIADYYAAALAELGVRSGRLLDMGCGTGSLTVRLAERGYDVIGQDASTKMLTIAAGKSSEVMWICQNMAQTDLGGTVGAVISTLDSINHLENAEAVRRCFFRAADCLECGGAFVFDVNTIYKHRKVLADNIFVYDIDGVYCIWQNSFDPLENGVDIDLDLFFENDNGTYSRGGEHFREIAFSVDEYCQMLEVSGFEVIEIREYLTLKKPKKTSEKLVFLAKKR